MRRSACVTWPGLPAAAGAGCSGGVGRLCRRVDVRAAFALFLVTLRDASGGAALVWLFGASLFCTIAP